MENDESCMSDFKAIISSLRLKYIQPVKIQYERVEGQLQQGVELSLSWTQAFAQGDPSLSGETDLLFRPKYTVTVSAGDTRLFAFESIMGIVFELIDRKMYDEAWKNENARKVFFEKQIMKTLWPFIRQQAIDGMTRLGMPAIPLPWLTD